MERISIHNTNTIYYNYYNYNFLQSSPRGSPHTILSVYATFEMHPGSVSLLGCLVLSAFLLEFLQLYQIFIPPTSFSSWGRERSRMEPVTTFERKFESS
jgi:hypothetical protein